MLAFESGIDDLRPPLGSCGSALGVVGKDRVIGGYLLCKSVTVRGVKGRGFSWVGDGYGLRSACWLRGVPSFELAIGVP